MDSLLFAINAVAPLILVVCIGYFIKRVGIIPTSIAPFLNKLVFRLLLPSMLFLNVYKISDVGSIEYGYILYVIVATTAVFLIGLPIVCLVTKDPKRRGAVLQCVFRSNYALIGIPLVESVFGAEGLPAATLLSAVSIPLLNVLAIIALSIFGENGKKPSVKKILIDIAKNPLIDSIALGLIVLGVRAIFVELGISFRLSDITPLYTAIKYLSNSATPIALIALGVRFDFSVIGGMKKEIITGVLARTVVVPLVVFTVAYLFFDFEGVHYASFIAMFATPVSVSSAPMAQEMGADFELAGQLVVWTTLVSSVTLFLFIYSLRLLGIF